MTTPLPERRGSDPTAVIPLWEHPRLPEARPTLDITNEQVVAGLTDRIGALMSAVADTTQAQSTRTTSDQTTSVYEGVKGWRDTQDRSDNVDLANEHYRIKVAETELKKWMDETDPDLCLELLRAANRRAYNGEGNRASVTASVKSMARSDEVAEQARLNADRLSALNASSVLPVASQPRRTWRNMFAEQPRHNFSYDAGRKDAAQIHRDRSLDPLDVIPPFVKALPLGLRIANGLIRDRAAAEWNTRHAALGVSIRATSAELKAERALLESGIAEDQAHLSVEVLRRMMEFTEEVSARRAQTWTDVGNAITDIGNRLGAWSPDIRVSPGDAIVTGTGSDLMDLGDVVNGLNGSLREHASRAWAQLAARFYSRVVETTDPTSPDSPQYAPDGSVQVTTADGNIVRLYRDGTTARQEHGQWIRGEATGTTMEQFRQRRLLPGVEIVNTHRFSKFGIDGLVRAPRNTVDAYGKLGDTQLVATYNTEMSNWEAEGDDYLHQAHGAAEVLYTRLRDHVDGRRQQYDNAASQRAELAERLKLLRDNPDELAQRIALQDDISLEDAQRRLPTVGDLTTAVQRLTDHQNTLGQELMHSGTMLNRAIHSLGILTAGRSNGATITPRGSVYLQHATLNGYTGAWVISRGGRSKMYIPDENRYQEYDPAGQPVGA